MCILVVDDEPIILMVATESLEDAGHAVVTAEHAPAAIELIAKHPDMFTCLVTDLSMPGELVGTDLAEHMRRRYPAIPILMATALSAAATPEWRAKYHVELLTKPYTQKTLVETVQRLLSRL